MSEHKRCQKKKGEKGKNAVTYNTQTHTHTFVRAITRDDTVIVYRKGREACIKYELKKGEGERCGSSGIER